MPDVIVRTTGSKVVGSVYVGVNHLAIQEAVDYVNANGGGKVLVENGEYLINSNLARKGVQLYSNVTLEGQTVAGVILKPGFDTSNEGYAVIHGKGTINTPLVNIQINKLTIGSATAVKVGNRAIHLENIGVAVDNGNATAVGLTVSGCQINYNRATAIELVNALNNIKFVSNTITNNDGTAIKISNPYGTRFFTLESNTINNHPNGFAVEMTSGGTNLEFTIKSNTLTANKGGLMFNNTGSNKTWSILTNSINANSGGALSILGTEAFNMTFTDGTFNGNTTVGGYGVRITGNVDNLVMTGTNILNNGSYGLYIGGATSNENITMTRVTTSGNAGHGILFAGSGNKNVKLVTVVSSSNTGTNGYGMRFEGVNSKFNFNAVSTLSNNIHGIEILGDGFKQFYMVGSSMNSNNTFGLSITGNNISEVYLGSGNLFNSNLANGLQFTGSNASKINLISIQASTNTGTGLAVGSGANNILIDSCTFNNNKSRGLDFSSGLAQNMYIKSCTINTNTSTSVHLGSGTRGITIEDTGMAGAGSYGVFMENNNEYTILRNCTISSKSQGALTVGTGNRNFLLNKSKLNSNSGSIALAFGNTNQFIIIQENEFLSNTAGRMSFGTECSNILFENNLLTNCAYGLQVGAGVINLDVVKNHFHSVTNFPVEVQSSDTVRRSENINILNNQITKSMGSTSGVSVSKSKNTKIIDNDIFDVGLYGIIITDATDVVVSRNTSRQAVNTAIRLHSVSNGTITNNNINQCTNGGMELILCTDTMASGNIVSQCGGQGVLLENLLRVVFTGNAVYQNSLGIKVASGEHLTISENEIYGNSGVGLDCLGLKKSSLVSNLGNANTSYNIRTDSACSNLLLVGIAATTATLLSGTGIMQHA